MNSLRQIVTKNTSHLSRGLRGGNVTGSNRSSIQQAALFTSDSITVRKRFVFHCSVRLVENVLGAHDLNSHSHVVFYPTTKFCIDYIDQLHRVIYALINVHYFFQSTLSICKLWHIFVVFWWSSYRGTVSLIQHFLKMECITH